MQIDVEEVRSSPDPTTLLRNFVPSNEELVLAAEINGNFVSNFPDGPPKTDRDNFKKENQRYKKERKINKKYTRHFRSAGYLKV